MNVVVWLVNAVYIVVPMACVAVVLSILARDTMRWFIQGTNEGEA